MPSKHMAGGISAADKCSPDNRGQLVAASVSVVTAQMELNSGLLGRLNGIVGALAARLQPLLEPPQTVRSDEAKVEPHQCRCELAERLHEDEHAIMRAMEVLEDLLARLEV